MCFSSSFPFPPVLILLWLQHIHTHTHTFFTPFVTLPAHLSPKQCHNAVLCQLCSMNCSQALRQFTLRMTDSCIFSSTGACSDNRARVTGAFWVGALLLICRLKGQRTDSVQKLKRALGYSAALMRWLSVKVYKRGSRCQDFQLPFVFYSKSFKCSCPPTASNQWLCTREGRQW